MSNLQPDNSIHVTRPDNGREPIILNKADCCLKVNAIVSDTKKNQHLHKHQLIMKLEYAINRTAKKNPLQEVISHHQYTSIYFLGSK